MNPQDRELTQTDMVRLAASLACCAPDSADAEHLLEPDFIKYVNGANGDSEAERIDQHLGGCDECCDKMARVAEFARAWSSADGRGRLARLRASILQEQEPARLVDRESEIREQGPRLVPVMTQSDGFRTELVHDPKTPSIVEPQPCAGGTSQQRGSRFLLPLSHLHQSFLLMIRKARARVPDYQVARSKWAPLIVVSGVVLALGIGILRYMVTPSPSLGVAERAYPGLLRTVSAHQQEFFIYDGSESWRNHGVASLSTSWFTKPEDFAFNHGFPSGFFASSPEVLSKIHVDAGCIYDSGAPSGCSTDTTSLDRVRGQVIQIRFNSISAGEFAGINFEEPANYGVLRSGNGYDLRGVQRLEFSAISPGSGRVVRFGVGEEMGPYLFIPAVWTPFSLDLASLGLTAAELSNAHVLFTVSVDYGHSPGDSAILIDHIRFGPAPNRTQTVLGLPPATQTFGIVPVANKRPGRVSIPPDQVNRNLGTIYESSLATLALLNRQESRDLVNARTIADTFVYALGHDVKSNPIPRSPDGSGGLRNAYSSGDIAMLNERGGAGAGEVRLAGFTIASDLCGPNHFCLVLDGAAGGNNAYAILALSRVFEVTGDKQYLDSASEIGEWITGNLSDPSPYGYGGYFVGYPDEGLTPKGLQKGKSTENNAVIYAAFTELARLESSRGDISKAAGWTRRADVAGDFVMSMFDGRSGHFHAGTVPLSQALGLGVTPDGPLRGEDVVNTDDFLDADTTAILALADSTRYRNRIDWHRPIERALQRFGVRVQAAGTRFEGFNIAPRPSSGPNGIAWEFTAQVVSAMRLVDGLYRENVYQQRIEFYLSQIRKAQISAPFTDGEGIVAATLENGDQLPPYEQCLSTPFQCIPERVGLAATTWSILADRGINPLRPSPLPGGKELNRRGSAAPNRGPAPKPVNATAGTAEKSGTEWDGLTPRYAAKLDRTISSTPSIPSRLTSARAAFFLGRARARFWLGGRD